MPDAAPAEPAEAPAPTETPAAAVPGAPATFAMTVHEWCARTAAAGERRVEMLSAFFADETAAGRIKDAAEAIGHRFTAFCERPL